MAILEVDGQTKEVSSGEGLIAVATELGIAFGCTQGRCGTCRVTVLEGMENLSKQTDEEIEMGLNDNERLLCQCTIESGTVKVKQGL